MMSPGVDPDVHYFHYHCDRFGEDIRLEDFLIPHYELDSAQQIAGNTVTCVHWGRQHPLFIRKLGADRGRNSGDLKRPSMDR
jgi:hypothetical protein